MFSRAAESNRFAPLPSEWGWICCLCLRLRFRRKEKRVRKSWMSRKRGKRNENDRFYSVCASFASRLRFHSQSQNEINSNICWYLLLSSLVCTHTKTIKKTPTYLIFPLHCYPSAYWASARRLLFDCVYFRKIYQFLSLWKSIFIFSWR